MVCLSPLLINERPSVAASGTSEMCHEQTLCWGELASDSEANRNLLLSDRLRLRSSSTTAERADAKWQAIHAATPKWLPGVLADLLMGPTWASGSPPEVTEVRVRRPLKGGKGTLGHPYRSGLTSRNVFSTNRCPKLRLRQVAKSSRSESSI